MDEKNGKKRFVESITISGFNYIILHLNCRRFQICQSSLLKVLALTIFYVLKVILSHLSPKVEEFTLNNCDSLACV